MCGGHEKLLVGGLRFSSGTVVRIPRERRSEFWFALGFLEALEHGMIRVVTKDITPESMTTRRYSKQEKDQVVRLVFEASESARTRYKKGTRSSAVAIVLNLQGSLLLRQLTKLRAGDCHEYCRRTIIARLSGLSPRSVGTSSDTRTS